ncbi:MAG: hypothetical protein K8W52_10600 [Deltaproteobacteria bacterium]|nr:hypothetical protein [Deltaproteobacteria bacterium]
MGKTRALLVLGLVYGCGGGSGNGVDAPAPIDAVGAAADAAPDSAPAAVRVTVENFGLAPVAGATVYFQDADSTLVAEAETDAQGHASAMLGAGGFVTVLLPIDPDRPDDRRADTIAGAQPGDDLHVFYVPANPIFDVPPTTFPLSIPADPQHQYQLWSSCGAPNDVLAQAPASSAVTLRCQPPGRVDMLLVSSDLTRSLYAPNITIADGVPLTLTGSYVAVEDEAFQYTGFDRSRAIGIWQGVFGPTGEVMVIGGGGTLTTGGTATRSYRRPPTVDTVTITQSTWDYQPRVPTDPRSVTAFEWGPTPSSYALAAADVKERELTAQPTYDATTHAVQWTEGTEGLEPGAVFASIAHSRPTGATTTRFIWTLAAAHDARMAATFPVLPNGGLDFTPDPGASVDAGLTTIAMPISWDRFRPDALGATLGLNGYAGTAVGVSREAPGRAVWASYTSY